MSSGDDKRSSRSTQRFDSQKLAILTKEEGDKRVADAAPDATDLEALMTVSRTSTVHDPMTMALLAEAARNSQTIEVDPATIEAAIADAASIDSPPRARDNTHPHLTRRSR